MIELGKHGSYILAAFLAAGMIIGWMIAASILAHRAAAARLSALETKRGE